MLLEKIKQTILTHKLIEPNDKVILGISGGHDSSALLDILVKLKTPLCFELVLAHVNYGFRGKDSDDDEKFVRNLAKRNKLKVYVKNLNPIIYNLKPNTNLEDFFRRVRYEFFEEILKKEKAQKIALAHTLDDQVETILMFFLRGAGQNGLCGMEIRRGKIIRPLLEIPRKEISRYLKENNLSWRRDATNEDVNFTRNKIRHLLIPFLEKEFNPNLKNTLAMSAKIMRDELTAQKEILRKIFKKIVKEKRGNLEIDLKKFLSLPLAFRRKIILEILERHREKISFVFLEDVLKMVESGKVGAIKNIANLQILKKSGKIIISSKLKI
jgi:tRNA(Ile)-lysidine synthase